MKPLPTLAAVRERNQRLADRINQEAKQNPNSPYAGKFVGIVDYRLPRGKLQ
ncbi:MAG: hypothetical protein MUE50_23915 [Pirellulaceae bacterium]|jgi:hypothetical protein|nr:hypothetical protein [Pirellulaceae bacterium]